MSFIKSESNSEVADVYGLCNRCMKKTLNTELGNFGAMCQSCFVDYCNSGRKINVFNDKYVGDPKGWAKRIIDRHNAGEVITPISLKFAQMALKNKHEY